MKTLNIPLEHNNYYFKAMQMNNIFKIGEFVLASGKKSKYKIDLEHLKDEDWETIAWWTSSLVGPFSSVEGVPTGGLKMAKHLQKFVGVSGPHLIVDDIVTSGGSMNRQRDKYLSHPENQGKEVVGVVVIARGPCPWWINCIFNMHSHFWV